MDKSLFFETDGGSILSQIKHQEEQLLLKRRWLLDFPVSNSKHDSLERPDFLNCEFLPESLLREDDVFYETIKSHVEEAFGICENGEGRNAAPENESKVHAEKMMRLLDKNLDALTNKGLHLVAMIVTGGSVPNENTRPKLKGVIRDLIAKNFRKKMHDDEKADTFRQLHQILNDPGNFRRMCVTNLSPTFWSHRDAAVKVLNELENLSSQTLIAMKRKLKGTRITPQLKSCKSGQSRSHLIKQVREASEKMLLELTEDDELPEPLAKAMALVDLSYKLNPRYKSASAVDFYQFSPEIKNLQNEIVKAIWLLSLNKKVRFSKLKKLQPLLDPEAVISNDSFRSSTRKMLTEYLFECSDMDTIPKSLLKALLLVNRSSWSVERKVFPKEAVEEEVECILNVGAQIKEIFWHWLPDYELDQDFSHAYMEELEDSDDENSSIYDNDEFYSGDNIYHKLEVRDTHDDMGNSFHPDREESCAECSAFESRASTGGTDQNSVRSSINGGTARDLPESVTRVCPASLYVTPVTSGSRFISGGYAMPVSKCQVKIERDEEGENVGMESENQFSSHSLFSVERTKIDQDEQKPCRNQNQYLTVQELSDETSMVAYNLIGHLLETFAEEKGLDLDGNDRSYLGGNFWLQESRDGEGEQTLPQKSSGSVVGTIKELLPSLDKSVFVRLEELMDKS